MPGSLNFNAEYQQAARLLQNREHLAASRVLEGLHRQQPKNVQVLALMARAADEQGDHSAAVNLLQKAITLDPTNLRLQTELAVTYTLMGKYRQAISVLEKALRASPNDLKIVARLADALESAGEIDRARELMTPLFKNGTATPHIAAVWAKTALAKKEPEDAVGVLSPLAAAHDADYPPDFWFTYGKACEQSNRIETAFQAYCRGNSCRAMRYNLDEAIEMCGRVIRTLTRATLRRLPKPARPTAGPIFIAGRPRSGTTLVEKILDAHPAVRGVGEMPHLPRLVANLGFEIASSLAYPEAVRDLDAEDVARLSSGYLDLVTPLAGGRPHTADKTLENYSVLGMVQALLPQSHAIHIEREAVDNCWAIFVADLRVGWSQDLRTLGVTHALYERYMQHWKDELDLPILQVNYESIVDDLEGQTRRMLEFCGLPWDERCLRYYESTSKATDSVSAQTLSYNQVRQPIYKTSVGRARKFDEYLGPLREGLEEGRRIAAQLGQAAR